jgi:hypothetical protein
LALGFGTEGYSPSVLRKIEYAGGNSSSFKQASEFLQRLAGLSVDPKHVARITERLGAERLAQREEDVRRFKDGKLKPRYQNAPGVAVVEVDAGKCQLRDEGASPGVHGSHWGDTKVANLLSFPAPELLQDYQPDPPAAFLDKTRVPQLCAEMEKIRREAPPAPSKKSPHRGKETPVARRKRMSPCPLMRTTVATTGNVDAFGYLVATEAHLRNFHEAKTSAVIGDGGNWIGPLADLHFPDSHQILDFLHLLVHLYAASISAYRNQPARSWPLYVSLLTHAWRGQTKDLREELDRHAARIGKPLTDTPEDDPRSVLARVVKYVRDNESRMKYPEYRRLGLPITSSLVESLIKQFNQRIKGSEKFWCRSRVEGVLQVRGAYLSEDDRADRHFAQRPLPRAVGAGRRGAAA